MTAQSMILRKIRLVQKWDRRLGADSDTLFGIRMFGI